jgi:hypothetical protein
VCHHNIFWKINSFNKFEVQYDILIFNNTKIYFKITNLNLINSIINHNLNYPQHNKVYPQKKYPNPIYFHTNSTIFHPYKNESEH